MRKTKYHVFREGSDVWLDDETLAHDLFEEFCESGSARLYREVYSDYENDVLESEDCLAAFGPYPA